MLKKWVCLLLLLLFPIKATMTTSTNTIKDPAINVISYDYGVMSPFGEIDHGVERCENDMHMQISFTHYSVDESFQDAIEKKWMDMREYWLRVSVFLPNPGVQVQSMKFAIKNSADIRIWCVEKSGEYRAGSAYKYLYDRIPIPDVVFLLVDPMGQSDGEILERLKAMDLICEIGYLPRGEGEQELVVQEISVSTEGLERDSMTQNEGIAFIVESCSAQKISIPLESGQYYYVPESIKKDIEKNPEDYMCATLYITAEKHMPYPAYKIWFAAFEDENVWCTYSATGFMDPISGLTKHHYIKNGAHSFTIMCIVKTGKQDETTFAALLQDSGISAYYSTEGVGDLFNFQGGLVRYGPIFQSELIFDSTEWNYK